MYSRMLAGRWLWLVPLVWLGPLPAGTAQSRWIERKPATSPPPRAHAAMAFDVGRGRTVLFGGWVASPNYLGDTWEWDGTTWTQRSPGTAPSPRHSHAMAHDRARGRTVLFGGWTSSGPTDDTWEWDGTTWRLRTPVTRPTPQSRHAMTYDALRRRVVLYGGATNGVAETWEWDGTTWARTAPVRLGVQDHSMAFLTAAGHSVVFGGFRQGGMPAVTETWDGASWTALDPPISPPPRAEHVLCEDFWRGRLVLFGGKGSSSLRGDTWEWNGTTWTQRLPRTQPTPQRRFGAAMTFDHGRRRAVLFGGRADGSSTMLGDTWEYESLSTADVRPFGAGCAASRGVPVLASSGELPWLGAELTLTLGSLPPRAPAALLSGASRSSWRTFRLPLALDPWGMPGCFLLVAPDVPLPLPAASSGATGVTFGVPANPWLIGRRLWFQGLVSDPTANAAGVAFSAGIEVLFGQR